MPDGWPAQQIRATAELEIKQEDFRAAVEREKASIREKSSQWRWWHRFIPIVKVTWRNK